MADAAVSDETTEENFLRRMDALNALADKEIILDLKEAKQLMGVVSIVESLLRKMRKITHYEMEEGFNIISAERAIEKAQQSGGKCNFFKLAKKNQRINRQKTRQLRIQAPEIVQLHKELQEGLILAKRIYTGFETVDKVLSPMMTNLRQAYTTEFKEGRDIDQELRLSQRIGNRLKFWR